MKKSSLIVLVITASFVSGFALKTIISKHHEKTTKMKKVTVLMKELELKESLLDQKTKEVSVRVQLLMFNAQKADSIATNLFKKIRRSKAYYYYWIEIIFFTLVAIDFLRIAASHLKRGIIYNQGNDFMEVNVYIKSYRLYCIDFT